MTPVFGLCDDYMTRWAALDPVAAGMQGLSGAFGAATDYSPDGYTARAELMTVTLAALEPLSVTSAADRLAAGFLRERLEGKIEVDFDTARRLFTLICVLQLRG